MRNLLGKVQRAGSGRCLCCLLAVALAAVGCAPAAKDTAKSARQQPAVASEVRVDGSGLVLSEGWHTTVTADQLMRRVQDLLGAKREVSADWLVTSHPDVALEALRAAGPAQAGLPALQFIAASYDRATLPRGEGQGWSGVLRDARTNSAAYEAWHLARLTILEQMRQGRSGAAGVASPQGVVSPLVEIELVRLRGLAWLLEGKADKAASEFASAAGRAEPICPHLAAHLWLLHAEASKRGGVGSEAVVSWQKAVTLAGTTLRQRNFAEPVLWHMIVSLRPLDAQWPAAFAAHFAPAAVDPKAAGERIEAVVWEKIGDWRMQRGEAQLAIFAFARAQGQSVEPSELRLKQAVALLQAKQFGAAIAILAALAEGPDANLARAANAKIAMIDLQRDQVDYAVKALREVVEGGANWPGLPEANADLGLALLLSGQEKEGLEMLHLAQSKFAAGGQTQQLMKSLRNEEAYLRVQGKVADANTVAESLAKLERLPEVRRD